MKPQVPAVLDSVITTMTARLSHMPPGPEAFGLWGLRTILTTLRRDWDVAASQRVEEIDALLSLLERGASIVDAPLSHHLHIAVDDGRTQPRVLQIPALDALLDRLRAALIPLQEALESSEDVVRAALLRDSWRVLANTSRQRALHDSPW